MNTSSTTELTLPSEWDHDEEMLNDEELSASSHEEASKVFEQWQTDDQEDEVDDGCCMDIMQVDEQIGTNLLGDDIFHDPCVSPTGPLEELVYMSIDEDDVDRFSLSLLSDHGEDLPSADQRSKSTTKNAPTSSLPFEERYKATLQKLAESMKRSQETRKSLTMKTPKTEKYNRTSSVSGVLSSIEKSSYQLQIYLKNIQRV